MRDLWQKKWDTDNKRRQYYNMQKSITVETCKEKCRKEEVVLARLRLGHTGLKSTVYLMTKSVSGKCDDCNVAENVEHVILWCNKYSAERIILNVDGIWKISGRNEKMRDCCEALFLFLINTGLDQKI